MMNPSRETPSPFRILHLTSSAGNAGGERYLLDLIRFSDTDFQHEVVLPFHGPFEARLRTERIPVSVIDMNRRVSIRAVFQLYKICRRNAAGIIHTHGYRANLHGRLVGLMTGIRTIATVHVSLFDYRETPKGLRWIYLVLERALSVAAVHYLCVSEGMQRDMRRLGIARRKLTIVPNGIDPDRFKVRKSGGERRVDGRLGGAGGPVIGTMGRMVPEKGQACLIDAAAIIQKNFPKLQCLFAGEGLLLAHLKSQAKEKGLAATCRFPGFQADARQFYEKLDVFVLPSLREPFGLVILEAMACGVPVVATDAGGPRDIIADGCNGLLVPPEDPEKLAEAIQRLLKDRELVSRLSQNALETVRQQYDVRKTVRRVEKIYRSVMDAK